MAVTDGGRPRGSTLWVGLDPFGQEVVDRLGRWLQGLAARAHANVVTVALAAKLARFCWAIMARNDHYRAPT